jgi:DNA-binding SARP family transcriptional activator/WD40 repeat protein
MRIAVLGPLEVLDDDGVPVAVPGAKERLLLAVLAAGAPGVVSTDRLVEALWNGEPPATARKSLQAHLVRLRSALEPNRSRGSPGRFVVRRGAGYALATTEDVDALLVAERSTLGRARLAAGDAAGAERLLSAALDLWRGDPYCDWPDAAFAGAERRRLAEVRVAAATARLDARLALGRHADVVPEVERLLAEDPLQEEWWRLLVVALYRSGRQGDALAATQRARRVLIDELGADPGPRLRAAEAAVLAQDPALDLPVSPVAPPAGSGPSGGSAVCPYKGLAAYQSSDARLFSGRGGVVSALVARLVDAPLVAVCGPSGAGKSSVVRAGLVPALASGALPGSASWSVAVVTPGRRPVDALESLTGGAVDAPPTVLVCDQLEELWAPEVDVPERTAFLDGVLRLLDAGSVVRCVAVVRGDSVGRLGEHPPFAQRLGSALVLVPSMTEAELREAVREPAEAVGLTVEDELLEAITADVIGRPGALPLLSTALVGTWERRRGNRLTLAGYLSAGGVAGALSRSAEEAWADLDDTARAAAPGLFVRLADTDEGGALIRRPVPVLELGLDEPHGRARRDVVTTFVRHRLLAVVGDRLDVAHESLLVAWPRLSRWLEEDTAGRAVRRHLARAAADWQQRGRPDEELYRGARLAAALDWAARADQPTHGERLFLDTAQARAESELSEARDRAVRETRSHRRTRRLAAGLAAALVVALVAAGLAAMAGNAAERSSLRADANRLAALSATVTSLDLSVLLAVQAHRLADTPETRDGLLGVLAEHRRVVRAVPFPGRAQRALLGAAGRMLFIANAAGIVAWDVPTGGLPRVVRELTTDWRGWRAEDASPVQDLLVAVGESADVSWLRLVTADGEVRTILDGLDAGGTALGAAFSPDGRSLRLLLAEPSDGGRSSSWWLDVIEVRTEERRRTVMAGTYPAPVSRVVSRLSDDGSAAVLWSTDATVPAARIDLERGGQVPLPPPSGAVVGYRALPSGAAELREDGRVVLHDRRGRAAQTLEVQGGPVRDVAVAPDGTWAATVGAGGAVVLWRIDATTGRWIEDETLDGHDGDVVEAEIDRTGRRLVTVADDDTAIVWDVGPDLGLGETRPGLRGRWAAAPPAVVGPDTLAVLPTRPLDPSGDGSPFEGPGTHGVAATFLDPRTGGTVTEVVLGNTVDEPGAFASATASPDGRSVSVTSGLGATVLDVGTLDVVRRIELPAGGVTGGDGRALPAVAVCCSAWTADGSRLLVGTGPLRPAADGGALVVFDTTTWDEVGRVPLGVVPRSMALAPGGGLLAVASTDTPEVVLVDVATLEVRDRVQLAVDDRPVPLSFSPDGRLLAAGGSFGLVHLVDTGTWQAREPVLVHRDAMLQVAWRADGRTLVTTSSDGTVGLFDTDRALPRTAPLPASVDGRPGHAHVLPLPSGDVLTVNDQWGSVRYPMEPGTWLRAACAIVGRDLTPAEWDRYLAGRDRQPTCSDFR